MPRVIIADDHMLIREGICKVLSREADMQVVGEAKDFAELEVLVESVAADVAVMDINMPGAGALETLKRVRTLSPSLRIVVLSMMPEEEVGLDFLIAGAAGYVSKEAVANELVSAIRKAASGYRHMSPALAQRVAGVPPASHVLLSPREREVLCLIASGLTVKEIAARIGIGISTVHTHRARLLQKLDARSDVDLSRYALRHRLVV